MDKTLRDRLAEKQGNDSGGKFPKFVVPIINFNGNSGEFRVIPVVDGELSKEAQPVKSPISIVIVKKRSALATKLEDEPSYFSSEFSSPNERISLFTNTAGKVSFAESGIVMDLRQKYPTLKTKSILYVLFNGELHKLEVKGGSMSDFFDWQKNLQDEGMHSFETSVVVGSKKQKSEKAKKVYYSMTFTNGPIDEDTMDLIEDAMDVVNEAIKRQEDYQLSKLRTPAVPQARPAGNSFEDFAGEKKDSDPEEIPF